MSLNLADLLIFMFMFSLLSVSTPGELGSLFLLFCMGLSFLVGSMKSFWFGMLIWMTYISGLLVLFLFFVSLVPKSRFQVPLWGKMGILFSTILFIYIFFFGSEKEGSFMDTKMGVTFDFVWLGSLSFLCVFLAVLLLICIFVVSKMVSRGGGCMRYV